ncbi:MAG: transglycosylase SLT domain-containing protein [Gammaproteobacteria bacterium]
MNKIWISLKKIVLLVVMAIMVSACTPSPPEQPDNICSIFLQYPNWYWAANDTKKKWGVPVSVQMAIIFQESSFNANAKPPRGKLLWIIPWKRPTSADGYSQALDGTWEIYQRDTGNWDASRNNFKDASDFVGWYANRAYRKAGVSYYNAFALYLAYHEGIGNYQRGTYQSKPWLVNVAHKVQSRANMYQRQLATCEGRISKPWWKF